MALSRIVAMAMGLAGALGASQGPEFVQQYTQRLGGAIEELQTVVARFDEGAAAFGLGRDDAIARLERNADDLARAQGENARLAAERLEALQSQKLRLEREGDLARVVTLVRIADPQIARGTYEIYRPAVPVTVEGMIAAALGFVALWLLGFGGAKSAKFAGRKGMAAAKARFSKSRAAPEGGAKVLPEPNVVPGPAVLPRPEMPPRPHVLPEPKVRPAGEYAPPRSEPPARPESRLPHIDDDRVVPFRAVGEARPRIYRRDET